MEDGEGGLGKAGGTGCGHGMADHRLHRAQHRSGTRTGCVGPAVAEDHAEGLQLGAVAHGGGGAVSLDQPDGHRVQPGRGPGMLDGEHLTLGPGVHERGPGTVGRHAGPADHGVDPVAVALGIGLALEHEDARALAHQDAVGVAAERADHLGRRQGAQLAEHAPEREVMAVVDAAGQDYVSGTRPQLVDRVIDRDQRARARRVHRVRRTPEVEPVGDA